MDFQKPGKPKFSHAEKLPGIDDLGLSEKQIHNATIIRDAVRANVQAIENRKSVLRAVTSSLLLVIPTK